MVLSVRLLTLPFARGTRRANESVKKQKDINDKRFSFVLAFESVVGRAKRHSLDLLFRFASRQNEKQASLMRVSKKEKSIYYRQFKY